MKQFGKYNTEDDTEVIISFLTTLVREYVRAATDLLV